MILVSPSHISSDYHCVIHLETDQSGVESEPNPLCVLDGDSAKLYQSCKYRTPGPGINNRQ